jgi:hypothetical protein
VIQNHFAKASNVGDVAAKEEVWEVTAQLLGLGLSVVVLELVAAQDGDQATLIICTWALVQVAHIVLRCVASCFSHHIIMQAVDRESFLCRGKQSIFLAL